MVAPVLAVLAIAYGVTKLVSYSRSTTADQYLDNLKSQQTAIDIIRNFGEVRSVDNYLSAASKWLVTNPEELKKFLKRCSAESMTKFNKPFDELNNDQRIECVESVMKLDKEKGERRIRRAGRAKKPKLPPPEADSD